MRKFKNLEGVKVFVGRFKRLEGVEVFVGRLKSPKGVSLSNGQWHTAVAMLCFGFV